MDNGRWSGVIGLLPILVILLNKLFGDSFEQFGGDGFQQFPRNIECFSNFAVGIIPNNVFN
jgi:hypothetical protein